ncbi:hypothetical protein [Burkholderia cenocepacia]|uniref:hypothetical protein n=1 Tax=Burkholderia cenocepacia TaxID=95486 RepID=UPI0038445635
MKKLLIKLAAFEAAFFLALAPLASFAQSYPAPTFSSLTLQNPLAVSSGGTGTTTSTGTGSVVRGTSPTIASPTITGGFTATGLVTLPSLAAQAANTVVANVTGSSASPSAFAMPSCSTSASALQWTSGTGFTCGSGFANLSGATFTGNIKLQSNNASLLISDGGASAGAHSIYLKGGTTLWDFHTFSLSGDLSLDRWVSGAFADSPIYVSNSTGLVTFADGISSNSSSNAITGGSINNAAIGNVTPSTAVVTSLNGGQLGGRRNPIINSDFNVWQLGTSFSNPGNLTPQADRWNFSYNGTIGTFNISQYKLPSSDWSGNFNFRYAARLTQSVAGSGNTFYDFSTQIEGVSTFAGQPIVISFWAKAFSGTPTITAIKTEQFFGTGGSGITPSAFTTSGGITLSNTWQRYSVTATLASITGTSFGSNGDDSLDIIFTLPLNQTFDIGITGVQVETGAVMTPYEGMSPADEMMASQRYTQTSYSNGTAPGTVTATGEISFVAASSTPTYTIQLAAPMRVVPVVTLYNPATGATGTWNNQGTAVSAVVNTNGTKYITVSISGATTGSVITGHYLLRDPSL